MTPALAAIYHVNHTTNQPNMCLTIVYNAAYEVGLQLIQPLLDLQVTVAYAACVSMACSLHLFCFAVPQPVSTLLFNVTFLEFEQLNANVTAGLLS